MLEDEYKTKMEIKLSYMFHAHGYGSDYDIPWIADMFIRGIFKYTSEDIKMLKMPPDFGLILIGNESEKHLDAKYTAYQYLLKNGAEKPLFEHCYWDVYSPKLSTVVECGSTKSNRLIKTLLVGVKNFWVLQYPGGVTKPPMLHKFSLVNEDIERLKRYQELRKEKVTRSLITMGQIDYYGNDTKENIPRTSSRRRYLCLLGK